MQRCIIWYLDHDIARIPDLTQIPLHCVAEIDRNVEFANPLLDFAPVRILMEKTLGISAKRSLPHYTRGRFDRWFEKRRLEGTAYVLAETGRPAAARLALAVATLLRDAPQRAHEIPFVAALVGAGIPGLFARSEAPREGALVLTPEEVLKARRSSHPGHTRG